MYSENFEMKSGFLSIKSISVRDDNLKEFETHIKRSVKQAPFLFKFAPFFVDVSEIKNLNFEEVYSVYSKAAEIYKENGMFVLGVKDCKKSHKELFQEKGVLVFLDIHGTSANIPLSKTNENEKNEETVIEKIVEVEKVIEKIIYQSDVPPMIYEGVVRGGQQIYAEGRDLIIFGHVKTGAEVAAGKNLIVMGSAEGRLIAGIDDKNSIIVANKFKASLVSIHGNFLIIEEDNEHLGKTVKIKLNDGQIIYQEMDS
jgi:septum site-determining protein MinC